MDAPFTVSGQILPRREMIELAETAPITTTEKPGKDGRGLSWGDVGNTKVNDRNLQALARSAQEAYVFDGLVRSAVDRYAESFNDIRLSAQNPRALKYLTNRLDMLSLRNNTHWKTILTRYQEEFWKHGNPMLIKVRGTEPAAVRVLYDTAPYPIIGVFSLNPANVTPSVDNDGTEVWKVPYTSMSYRLVERGARKMDGAFRKVPSTEVEKGFVLDGRDLIHTPYKKPNDTRLGVGFLFGGLNDVRALRKLELHTLVMVQKQMAPLIHHRLLRATQNEQALLADMRAVAGWYRQLSGDGILVTGPGHEIKAVGAESHALRVGDYLKYFSNRGFAGLGVTPSLMGFDSGTLGSVEASKELIRSKVESGLAEVARHLEMFLLWEMLWEGGFNPYLNEADRVYIEFVNSDWQRRIKEENHLADLYTKNFVGYKQAISRTRFVSDPPPPANDMFLKRVEIPRAEAGGKADNPAKTSTSSIVSRKEYPLGYYDLLAIESALPKNPEEVEDFILFLASYYEVDPLELQPLAENLTGIAGDDEACFETVQGFLQPETP